MSFKVEQCQYKPLRTTVTISQQNNLTMLFGQRERNTARPMLPRSFRYPSVDSETRPVLSSQRGPVHALAAMLPGSTGVGCKTRFQWPRVQSVFHFCI